MQNNPENNNENKGGLSILNKSTEGCCKNLKFPLKIS